MRCWGWKLEFVGPGCRSDCDTSLFFSGRGRSKFCGMETCCEAHPLRFFRGLVQIGGFQGTKSVGWFWGSDSMSHCHLSQRPQCLWLASEAWQARRRMRPWRPCCRSGSRGAGRPSASCCFSRAAGFFTDLASAFADLSSCLLLWAMKLKLFGDHLLGLPKELDVSIADRKEQLWVSL